ncbi:pitrilysin family protein [Proteiniborus sp. MB09-C3]|uniref:EF-P 5-aminopentanol modification-associated protein YfmF n=1 Tax=Proteiniborus sp. MB09-C3 TaxID=3050072 RepID=UPI00255649CB|nr:pitrilysin family protein [Proteiniborus sp. MB09-C3]WIV11253.1 pitrilysin family protein [Proteiniborus sp. MB09-C3]
MEYNRREVGKCIGVNRISTDKFKSSFISFSFIRPLSNEEASLNALVPSVLKRGTMNYKTSMDIQKKLEELYGANLNLDVNKKGEKHIIRFSIEGPDAELTGAGDYNTKLFDILLDIIYNPLLEDGVFVEKYITQEKENLIKRIEGRINDKKQYAFDRAIEEMCKGEKFSVYKFGDIDNVKKIDNKSLYDHYKNMLETSPIEITIVGKSLDLDIEKILSSKVNLNRKDIIDIPRESLSNKKLSGKSVIFEKMDVSQGKLILGYRINIPYDDKLFDAFIVASEILGGGPNSKLFLYVREKESLAYYVYSQVLKYKSIMLISSGIESKNFEKTKEIIKSQVEEMIKGNFTEEDIKDAKNSITTSIKELQDNNYSIAEYYLSNAISKEDKSFDDYVKSIQSVTREEIIKSCELKLDTIYFLTNEDEG